MTNLEELLARDDLSLEELSAFAEDKGNELSTEQKATLKSRRKKMEKLKKRAEQKERRKQEKQEKKKEEAKQQTPQQQQQKQQQKGGKKVVKKNVDKMGIDVAKEEDFGEWYQQVIVKSEMIDYYDVSGCYILRPWSYQIWEHIQHYLDTRIKQFGVQNAYFPMFVTKSRLETEEDHVEGFAPEVAWVTKSGESELAEPIALRPTSETIMYPAYSNWIRSHRDLPLKLNQWSNVVRWEFKHPVPFLRSREFLWQEGHTAYATRDESVEEVYDILELYRSTYEDLLAVPVIKGQKTDMEKFAGGDFTTTVEAYIDTNGRAVQGATSHCLGQNFSKMFNIQYETEEGPGEKEFVWQNSWGMTTRTIGVMIMVHGDDKGLVLPPRVAPVQVVIVPIYFKDAEKNKLVKEKAAEIGELLTKKHGLRIYVDSSENKTGGFKFHYWERRGVPLRMEIGPKDLEKDQVMLVARHTGSKNSLSMSDIEDGTVKALDNVQREMFEKAKATRDQRIDVLTNWEDFVPSLDKRNMCLAPFCETTACEENIKKRSGEESKRLANESAASETTMTGSAKSLCIPLEQRPLEEDAKCFCCGAAAKSWTLFGRSY